MPLDTMMTAARELPEHVREAVDAAERATLPAVSPSSILMCGMGGSSFGGALAAELLAPRAPVPVQVLRDHEPPGFVDDGTLAIVTSYSGNTQETIDAARACHKAGAELVAITTGGELAELASDMGAPVISPPTGYQPRAAVGWLWGANHATLAAALALDETETMLTAADRLEQRVDELAREGGRADELAGLLGDGPIGVLGHDVFGTVARRWAGELAENAKRLAFHDTLPEAMHNQIVGWDGHPGGADLIVVGREDENPLEAARTSFLAERARQAGASVHEERFAGAELEAVLEAILVGDLASLHLARREGTDPEPVDVIDALKDRLDTAGSPDGSTG